MEVFREGSACTIAHIGWVWSTVIEWRAFMMLIGHLFVPIWTLHICQIDLAVMLSARIVWTICVAS